MSMEAEILQARVNGLIGVCLVGAVALGAGLLIWHAATGENALANALTPYVTPATVGQ